MSADKSHFYNEKVAVLSLAFIAALLAWFVASQVYQYRPLTTDENSYLFQAQLFREGRISRPLPPISHAFDHSMIILNADAGWLSRYPPLHAIWLLPGILMRSLYLMSILGAALGVYLMSRIAKRLSLPPAWTALLTVISPFYIFLYGSLLSHTSGFILTAAMFLFYISWVQEQRFGYSLLAGLCWGLLVLNRSYTALLIAIPFGVDASLTFLSRRNMRTFWGCTLFAGTSASFLAIFRLYNKFATGSSRVPTYLLYDPSEGLGFGPRHTDGLVIHHTFERGIQNVLENLVIMDKWIWGVTGGLILVALLAIAGWKKRWTPLMLAVPLFVWLGHIGFWYAGLEHFRPVYFFETMVFLIIAAACGFHFCFRQLNAYPRYQMALKVSIILLLLFGGLPFTIEQGRFFFAHNEEAKKVHDLIQSAPPQSLVLLKGVGRKALGENMLNIKGLASDPLVARSNPFWDHTLISLFPEKQPFIIDLESMTLSPYPISETLSIQYDASKTHRRTGTDFEDADGNSYRTATPGFREGFLLFGRYPYLSEGLWRIRLYYSLDIVEEERPVRFEIAADRGHVILNEIPLHGSKTNAYVDLMISLDDIREIEPRIHYGGSGTVALSTIDIDRVDPNSTP